MIQRWRTQFTWLLLATVFSKYYAEFNLEKFYVWIEVIPMMPKTSHIFIRLSSWNSKTLIAQLYCTPKPLLPSTGNHAFSTASLCGENWSSRYRGISHSEVIGDQHSSNWTLHISKKNRFFESFLALNKSLMPFVFFVFRLSLLMLTSRMRISFIQTSFYLRNRSIKYIFPLQC